MKEEERWNGVQGDCPASGKGEESLFAGHRATKQATAGHLELHLLFSRQRSEQPH